MHLMHKFRLSVTPKLALAVALAAFVIWFVCISVGRYDTRLFIEWHVAYESGDYILARSVANRMRFVDKKNSSFLLAVLAVTDSIKLDGKAKKDAINTGLRTLESVDFTSWPSGGQQTVLVTKASLNAMLGRKEMAVKYANEACDLLAKTWPYGGNFATHESCMSRLRGDGSGVGHVGGGISYRYDAIGVYDAAALSLLIDGGDSDGVLFSKALSLQYFDVDQARKIRDGLIKAGKFTPQMEKAYCATESLDPVTCKG
jgi:hypothetical protein